MWKKLKKAVKKVVKTIKKVVRVIKEITHRLVKVIDFIGSLIGIRPKKYLRARVFILKDLKGTLIKDIADVEAWVAVTKKVFKDRANIELTAAFKYGGIVTIIDTPAPAAALFPECSFGFSFSDEMDYYDDQATYPPGNNGNVLMDLLGYGEPVYAFIVSSVSGGDSNGCSWPLISNIAVVKKDARPTTMAHELAHLCGARHSNGPHHLMNGARVDDIDSEMTTFQISTVRTSRYVTYLRP
jgi:hypothetical protein